METRQGELRNAHKTHIYKENQFKLMYKNIIVDSFQLVS